MYDFFPWRETSFLVLSRGHPRTCESVSRRRTHLVVKTTEDLRALTDAEHALASVAAFCHFYGPRVPKIWPLSTAKRNTLVSKTRKHDTTTRTRGPGSEGPCVWSHIIRLSYNPSSARSSVHERSFFFVDALVRRRREQRAVCLFAVRIWSEHQNARSATLTREKKGFQQWWSDRFRV